MRPTGAEAERALARVRASAADLADAALWPGPERGAARLVRRRLLRALAAAVLDVHPDRVAATRDRAGRPALSAPAALHASVARHEGWAALALSPRPVGVDLEAARPADPLPLDLLPPAEAAALRAEPDAEARARRFARLWCAREAYLKAAGLGLGATAGVRARETREGARLDGPAGPGRAEFREADGVLAALAWTG